LHHWFCPVFIAVYFSTPVLPKTLESLVADSVKLKAPALLMLSRVCCRYIPEIGPSQGYIPEIGPSQGYIPEIGPSQGYIPKIGPSQGYIPEIGPSQGYIPEIGPSQVSPTSAPHRDISPRFAPHRDISLVPELVELTAARSH
jgi:hypothetical protein